MIIRHLTTLWDVRKGSADDLRVSPESGSQALRISQASVSNMKARPLAISLGVFSRHHWAAAGCFSARRLTASSVSTAYPDTGMVRPRSNAQHSRNRLVGPLRTPTPCQCRSSACAVGSVSPIHASLTHSGASPMGRRVMVICMPGCWRPDQMSATGGKRTSVEHSQ